MKETAQRLLRAGGPVSRNVVALDVLVISCPLYPYNALRYLGVLQHVKLDLTQLNATAANLYLAIGPADVIQEATGQAPTKIAWPRAPG